MNILDKKYDAKIKELTLIHNITQYYILLGEEISADFNTFIQPLKEFRDSHEHIMRIFRYVLFNDRNITESDYIEKQLTKALGHEYRAFFDVVDWLSIVCRKAVSDALTKATEERLNDLHNNDKFIHNMKLVIESDLKIADIRSKKDINSDIDNIVNEYQILIKELCEATKEIRLLLL